MEKNEIITLLELTKEYLRKCKPYFAKDLELAKNLKAQVEKVENSLIK